MRRNAQRSTLNVQRSTKMLVALACVVASRVSADTHYVDINCATPIAPYTNWTTAATAIQDAVDMTAVGDTVLVASGIYGTGGRVVYGSLSNRVAITKAIVVRSVNGPAVTSIQGVSPMGINSVRCVYVGTNATLAGFTLTNGATRSNGDMRETDGGAIYCDPSGTLSNCFVSGNSAIRGGGARFGTLINCTLTGNWATIGGGGAHYGTLINCTLDGNTASSGSGGGAVACTLNNCTLSGNAAFLEGGGAYGGILNNCTLTGNSASSEGGGAYFSSLNNCIVYYNRAPVGPNYSVEGCTLNYCCTTPVPSGTGNIADDPCLVSQSHIALDSPCTGKGSANFVLGVDIDGEGWRTPPSMGTDEPYAASATGDISVAIGSVFTNVPAGFPISFTALIKGRVTRSVWSFGDGSELTNLPYASHYWSVVGTYNVVLTAWNTDHPAGVSCTTTVSIVVQPTYYVNVSNTAPSYPYTNWTTAATSIQQAISAGAGAGRLILVTNGLYQVGGIAVAGSMTNRVVLTDAITVRSVNGPGVTIIKGLIGSRVIRCAYVGNDCVLAGFTLTNGSTRSSGDIYKEQCGGGVWCEVAGVVSNCWIVNNAASWQGGGAAYGTMKDCTLIANSAPYGGGAFMSTLSNCILTGNSARTDDGGGAYFSKLNNCILTGNSASTGGGGVSHSTLNNCILTGNSASHAGGAYSSTLNNCTVAGNTAIDCGGVRFSKLDNSIIYYNMASTNVNYESSGSGAKLCYCCTTPAATGTGTITNPPVFRNIEGGNYRLSSSSPCIGAGLNEAWMFNATDLDGNSRIRNGIVDMGAYEFAFEADLKGLLQGPFDANAMAGAPETLLPTRSPYAADARTVAAVPSNTVDWALVEVLDTNRNALASTSVFLDPLGRVRDAAGSATLPVEVSAGSYYLALRHRNHLSAVSALPVAFTNTVVSYDFTTGADQYLGGTNACVELAPGLWGLIAGDADGDGRITPVDREIVRRQQGMTGYLQGDLNLDGKVDGGDE